MALVLVTAFAIAGRVGPPATRAPTLYWPLPVALGLRGALLGYLVTGFFLSVAYSGVFFAVLGVCAGLQNVVLTTAAGEKRHSEDEEASPAGPESKAGPRRPRPPAPVGGWRPITGGRTRGSPRVRRSGMRHEK